MSETTSDPLPLVNLIGAYATDRQLRFLAIACARRAMHLASPAGQQAIETAERFLQGEADIDEMRRAEAAANQAYNDMDYPATLPELRRHHADGAATLCCAHTGALGNRRIMKGWSERSNQWQYIIGGGLDHAAYAVGFYDDLSQSQVDSEQAIQCHIVRDIFGDLFDSPPVVETAWLAWRDRTIPKLAQAAYDDRELPSGHLRTDRLAILADALEEAGCSDQDMLGHLRGPGPHVRGCWVVDLLLGLA